MAPPTVPTYDPERVVVSLGSLNITGFGPDTMIKVTPSGDLYTVQEGASGDVARSRNASSTAEIEITLMATSQSNDLLSTIANNDRYFGTGIAPLQIKDLNSNSLLSAKSAWIKKWPDWERAKETGVHTWVLTMTKVNWRVGGGIV